MKKRAVSLFLTLAMALSLVTIPVGAAGEAPAVTNNINRQDYTVWSRPVYSYLFENEDGGLTRVECKPGSTVYTVGSDGAYTAETEPAQVFVEDYSAEFRLLTSHRVEMELPIWGGFFAGEDYNFFVFGQQNPSERDSAEVIRVVKYSKDWQRLGQASLRGANTTVPFDAGSLRMDEYGGQLYIRTSHEMYTSSDGLNHQANLTLCVDQESMAVLDSYYSVMNSSVGYVSHSFNQFVLVDAERNIVTLDQGDAYPRAAVLMKYGTKAGSGKFSGRVTSTVVQSFPGQTGNNATGASLGGLAETGTGYVVAYNYNGTGGSSPAECPVYLAYIPKNGGSATVRTVSSSWGTTPHLVSTGPDGGYILWNGKSASLANDTLYYASYDGDGGVGAVRTATGSLSDCAPIPYNGALVWYTTRNAAPVFYTLDDSGVTATPADGSGQSALPEQPAQSSVALSQTRPGGYEPLYTSWGVEFSGMPQTVSADETEYVFPEGTVMYVPDLGHSIAVVARADDYPWIDPSGASTAAVSGPVTLKRFDVRNSAGEWEPLSIPAGGGYLTLELGAQYRAEFEYRSVYEQKTYQYRPTFQAGSSQAGAAPAGFQAAYTDERLQASARPLETDDYGMRLTFPAGTVLYIPPRGAVDCYNGDEGAKAVYTRVGYSLIDGQGNYLDGGAIPAVGLYLTLEAGQDYYVSRTLASILYEGFNDMEWYISAADDPTQTEEPSGATFSDVPATHWAHSYVTEMASLGAVSGVGNGQFAPDRSVSTAEFSVMLSNLFFADELAAHPGESRYWWERYADVLLDAGALDGTAARRDGETGTWDRGPMEAPVTRYDMARIMYNILTAKGVAMPGPAELQRAAGQIADYSAIPDTYTDAVTAMYAMGCLSGVDSAGTFGGDSPMSRAAACVVLCNLLDRI